MIIFLLFIIVFVDGSFLDILFWGILLNVPMFVWIKYTKHLTQDPFRWILGHFSVAVK